MNIGKSLTMKLLLASVAFLLVLGACAPATPQVEREVVTEIVESTVVVEREVTPPSPEERSEDKLIVTYWSEPSNLDFHAFGTDGDNDARINILDRLIDRNVVPGPYDGTYRALTGDYVGVLAESWELDEENATLTFELKRDIEFSNGNPLTAEDVKFSFDRSMLSPTSYVGSLMSMLTITDPDQIVVQDEYTVQFQMEEVNPFIFELMSILVSSITDAETIQEVAPEDDPWATEWMQTNLIGTGPYVMSEFEPGVEYIFEPNPNYWNPDVYPRNGGVIIKVVPSASERLLLLKNGDVDVARGLDYKDIADLSSDPDIKVLRYTSTDVRYIGMNNNIAPFDDPDVRRAVARAIPYKDIIDTVYSGFAVQLKSPVPDGMPTSDFSFWEYDTDYDEARRLLAEAGYPDGFETTLFARAENTQDQQIAVLVQDALSNIGVEVTIESLLSSAYAERQFGARDMPMFFFEWISFINDPYYHFHFLARCGQGTNYVDYCDEEVDQLIDEGMFEADPERREEISRELQEIHVAESPWIYLAQPDSVVAMRNNIHGWTQHPDLIARYYTLWKAAE